MQFQQNTDTSVPSDCPEPTRSRDIQSINHNKRKVAIAIIVYSHRTIGCDYNLKNKIFEFTHTPIQTYVLFVQTTRRRQIYSVKTNTQHFSVRPQPHTACNTNVKFKCKHTRLNTHQLPAQGQNNTVEAYLDRKPG